MRVNVLFTGLGGVTENTFHIQKTGSAMQIVKSGEKMKKKYKLIVKYIDGSPRGHVETLKLGTVYLIGGRLMRFRIKEVKTSDALKIFNRRFVKGKPGMKKKIQKAREDACKAQRTYDAMENVREIDDD